VSSIARFAASLLIVPALASAEPVAYAPGSAADPQLRQAMTLGADARHFSAAILLEALAGDAQPETVPEAYQWQLADTLLAIALRDRAVEIYRHLAVITDDRDRWIDAQLRVAEFDYQRARYADAVGRLTAIDDQVPDHLRPRWQSQLAQVYLAESRYEDALPLLQDLEDRKRGTAYTRYNLGVALINSGEEDTGRAQVDRVGRMTIASLEDQALRDKANLTLGWHFLSEELGGSAKAIFQRIRVKGPFSNRALLGLGWAELSPRGERQRRAANIEDEDPFSNFSTIGGLLRPGFIERDFYYRAGFRNFRLSSISEDQEEALRRALAAWIELISRDPLDPAVQEGWLAIPYSLDKLGAHTQALQYYERAIEELEQNRVRMNTAMDSINGGRMIETIVRRDANAESGVAWRLKDLPDAPETYYLQSLLAEHRFQEALKRYRDLRLMARNLESWRERLAAVGRTYRDNPRDPVAVEDLLARARDGWTPPDDTLDLSSLVMAQQLAPPGRYDAALPNDTTAPPPRLKPSAPPARFNGPYERSQQLLENVRTLRLQVEAAADAQSGILNEMAREELTGQQKTIERYLVEARFALARLYDRQLKGELQ